MNVKVEKYFMTETTLLFRIASVTVIASKIYELWFLKQHSVSTTFVWVIVSFQNRPLKFFD